jgi:hypothetical protein
MFFDCSLVSLSTFFFFLAACSAPVESRKISTPIAVVNQDDPLPPGQNGFVYRDVEPEAKPIIPMLVTPLAFPRSAPTRLK